MLAVGEQVLLVDKKGRQYVIVLKEGGEFHSHAGIVSHDEIIGGSEAGTVRSTHGAVYRVLRPTLSEFIVKMPRGAQVIYPKDLGPILMLADIQPGHRVFESGVGSGALSMTLLRAGAIVTGYELRDDFAARAIGNVETFLGAEPLDRYHVEVRSSYDGIDPAPYDRVVLDLPEPWQVVPHAAEVLEPGGILLAYTPSVTQIMRLHDALKSEGFAQPETVEVLNRTWHVEGQAVRPDHRMVAHTGFLTHARRISD